MTPPTEIHPIEEASYEILRRRVDLRHLPAADRAVVERIIHASADLEYAATTVCAPGACAAAIEALARGAPVVCDAEMVRFGITAVARDAVGCWLRDPRTDELLGRATRPPATRSAAAIEVAAADHPHGAVIVVGNAPTALDAALDLVAAGRLVPAAIIGLPVGFVGAAEAKARLRRSGVPAVSNVGEKGGSAVAAAALNALGRLAAEAAEGQP